MTLITSRQNPKIKQIRGLAHKKQRNQYRRCRYENRVTVAHEVCAENDEAEHDRNVECGFDHQARCL